MDVHNTLRRLDALIAKADATLKSSQSAFSDAELRTELRSSGLSLIGRLLSKEHRDYKDFERLASGVSTDDARQALGILRSVRDEAQVDSGPKPVDSVVPVPTGNRRRVFVVHGRNVAARREMFHFLRAIGLQPLEWTEAVSLTGSATPYVGEVLDAAFRHAQAIVVLLTGDDMARLGTAFVTPTDPNYERELTPQPRPNVLFEAGMALGRHPERTVIVSFGETRPFSDVAGRHTIGLTNNEASRQQFLARLATAGCDVSDVLHRTDWLSDGDFEGAMRHPDAIP